MSSTDSAYSDTPDSPPLQDPYKTVVARWRSRVAVRSSPPSSPIRRVLDHCLPIDLHRDTYQIPLHRILLGDILLRICRSPTSSVPTFLPVRGALSLVRSDLSPPAKRIRDSDSVTDVEVSSKDGYEPHVPREVGLGVDFEDSYEPYTEPDIDSDIQMWMSLRPRRKSSLERDTIEVEVNPRVRPVIEEDVRESVRDDVLDHVIADGAVEVIESEQRLQGHWITGVDLEVTTITERIDTLDMPTATHTGMTQDVINELIAKRVDEALKAYDAVRNPRTEAEIKNERQDDHVNGYVNNGNGNGNGNGNPNVNNGGVVPVARECTYQDFVKCQP
ncbi:hypothetical protein Tco_1487076, partial [Tanacetum coccineum]